MPKSFLPVTTRHGFRTLVLTTGKSVLLLLDLLVIVFASVPLPALDIQLTQPTVTGDLQILGTGIAGSHMTGPLTGMGASFRPGNLALELALPAVDPCISVVGRLSDLVAVSSAGVVTTGQGPAARSAARLWLGHVTGKVGSVVRAQAGNRDLHLTIWTGKLLRLDHWAPLLPRNRSLLGLLRLDLHPIVAGSGADVTALKLVVAGQLAGRTIAKVTRMARARFVVTVGRVLAFQPAFRGAGRLLPAAGDHRPARPAVAGHILTLVAGVTGTGMAGGDALVILAGELFAAGLLAGRAVSVAALSVTGVLPAVALLLALGLAGVLLGAGHLLLLQPAPAGLDDHLKAGPTSAAVAPLHADVLPAAEHLSAGVPAGRGRQSAWEGVLGLSAGTLPDFRQRTRRALALVADDVAEVVAAFQGLVALLLALPGGLGALPLLLLALAVAELDGGLAAGLAGAVVTG